VPSLANGYPNSLVHLYQCLANAARLGLSGAVAEFGMFKGGTTMFLSRVIKRLGASWPVIGFDTFGGFPPRRSRSTRTDVALKHRPSGQPRR
jgi:O-methyltransferase